MNAKIDEKMNEVEADVLVVGAGGAGLWAAIRAKEVCPKVVLVEKSKIARSGATTFTHGVLAPVSDSDVYPAMKDLVEESEYLCNQARLEVILREQGDRIKQMESWGVPFLRDSSGNLFTQHGKMHRVARTCYSQGIPLVEKLRDHARSIGVDFVERVMITDLLTSDGQHPTEGRVTGAIGLNTRTGQVHVFKAKAVVLCTGPVGTKLHTAQADNLTGDGQAVALRAGADMGGMEFGEHPFFPIWQRKFLGLPPGALLTYQARPINALNENIVDKYYPGKTSHELTRYQMGYAIAKEVLEGRGPVYFDLSHLSDETLVRLKTVIPQDLRGIEEGGIDLRKQKLEVFAIAHTVMWASTGGGINKDLNGSASIPGLYGAGSSAHEGVNYSDSSGLAQAMCYVGGYRAGESAAKFALNSGKTMINADQVKLLKEEMLSPLGRKNGPNPEDIYLAANLATVPAQFSFFKHERRIKTVLAEMERIQKEMIPNVRANDVHQLVKANECKNSVQVLEVHHQCALERKETRFTHYREDYPYRDDVNWMKWIIVKKNKKGMTIRFDPIPIDDYPIKLAERKKIPSPLQLSWKK